MKNQTAKVDNAEDLYDVLQVKKSDKPSTIRKAFNRLVLKHHPDKGGDQEKFESIQSAYETLIDTRKRRFCTIFTAQPFWTNPSTRYLPNFSRGHFEEVKLEKENEKLRAINSKLERQMLIERPETANAFAKSFESWLRNHKSTLITSEDIARQYGVETFTPVKLAIKENLVARFRTLGKLSDVLVVEKEKMPKVLKWGEVLVQVLACPINGMDVALARNGTNFLARIPTRSILSSRDQTAWALSARSETAFRAKVFP